jgi:hypothetical protein
MILTDASGRPLEKPEPPSVDAPIDEKIAYLRAHAAYNDAVSSAANRAFAKAFRKAVRK